MILSDYLLILNLGGNTTITIAHLYYFTAVRNKWKFNIAFLNEFEIVFHAVRADSDNLSIQFLKFFQIPLEGNQFISSDRSEYRIVESKNDIFFTEKIIKGNLPLG